MPVRVTTGQLKFYLVILCISIAVVGCRTSAKTQSSNSSESKKEQTPAVETAEPIRIEKPIAPQAVAPLPALVSHPKDTSTESVPPTETEIAEAIKRAYDDSVIAGNSAAQQFVVGDFNCDGSQDIAIVVKPSDGKLDQINSEVANWSILSPRKVGAPVMTPVVRRSSAQAIPERVGKDERLLAIIHGFGAKGWRDPSAKQTYLLRDVAGDELKQISMKEFIKNVRDKDAIVKKSGDVISDSMNKETGFIYWNGSKYSWYH